MNYLYINANNKFILSILTIKQHDNGFIYILKYKIKSNDFPIFFTQYKLNTTLKYKE